VNPKNILAIPMKNVIIINKGNVLDIKLRNAYCLLTKMPVITDMTGKIKSFLYPPNVTLIDNPLRIDMEAKIRPKNRNSERKCTNLMFKKCFNENELINKKYKTISTVLKKLKPTTEILK